MASEFCKKQRYFLPSSGLDPSPHWSLYWLLPTGYSRPLHIYQSIIQKCVFDPQTTPGLTRQRPKEYSAANGKWCFISMGPFASCCLFDFSAPDYAYLNHYRIAQGSICNAIFFAHQFFSIFQNAFTPNDFVLACSIKKVGGSWNHTYRQLC